MVLAAVDMRSTGPLETDHDAAGVAGLLRPSLQFLQNAFDTGAFEQIIL